MLATAKIHILKQFTTLSFLVHKTYVLCLLLQRYTFWSNSQPIWYGLYAWSYCACYCKDTHFEAIHNQRALLPDRRGIVLATAKIHILKQFTTAFKTVLRRPDCACYCKDTHFEAIHNKPARSMVRMEIVLATAKIHILKQFTTNLVAQSVSFSLCLLLQRYTFWSNSQLYQARCSLWRIVLATAKIHILKQFTTFPKAFKRMLHCACYCKDTHFEAIHNRTMMTMDNLKIVLATAKIHILKQFTTCCDRRIACIELCLLLQRYTFWSNSQRTTSNIKTGNIVLATAKIHILKQFTTRKRATVQNGYCACYCKDTHFEAIHNIGCRRHRYGQIVLATAKIHILKQFTTEVEWFCTDFNCACYCKDTHFEAIHNGSD